MGRGRGVQNSNLLQRRWTFFSFSTLSIFFQECFSQWRLCELKELFLWNSELFRSRTGAWKKCAYVRESGCKSVYERWRRWQEESKLPQNLQIYHQNVLGSYPKILESIQNLGKKNILSKQVDTNAIASASEGWRISPVHLSVWKMWQQLLFVIGKFESSLCMHVYLSFSFLNSL